MTILLNAIEARILGALVEKEATTPEGYPLSLNALGNACNQKNNREPVMTLDEDDLRQGLRRLEDDQLAGPVRGTESRVTKYEHHLQEVFNFTRAEVALICVLLLRGPQTLGELRGRTERLHRFEELDDVQAGLQRLMQRDPSLAKVLPRQPGRKEVRYMHLLSGETESVAEESTEVRGSSQNASHNAAHNAAWPSPAGAESLAVEDRQRLADLEEQVAVLREELQQLTAEVRKFEGR